MLLLWIIPHGCGGGEAPSTPFPFSKSALSSSKESTQQEHTSIKFCPNLPDLSEFERLDELLNDTHIHDQSSNNLDWETTTLSLIFTQELVLAWWWSKSPAQGAHNLPPNLLENRLKQYQLCDQGYGWKIFQNHLWAQTRSLKRMIKTADSQKDSQEYTETQVPTRTIDLITACPVCPQSQVREAFGSPIFLTQDALNHLHSLLKLDAQEQWVATRIRPQNLRLDQLKGRSCRCLYR